MDAVIFDFDGVLVDSEPAHEACIRRVFEARGMGFSHAFFVERCIGTTDVQAFSVIAQENGQKFDEPTIRGLIAEKEAAFVELVAEGGVPLFPGAGELLHAVAEMGPIGVCSGSRRNQVEPTLEHHGLLDLLGVLVSRDEVDEPKPSPEGYLKAADVLGVPAARCSVVEDSPTGLSAAKAAGMRTVCVEHSFSVDRLAAADRVVRTIGELSAGDLLAAVV